MKEVDKFALNLFPDIKGNKIFLYLEDHQGYSHDYTLFETTCGKLNAKDYEKLSWAFPPSGRLSCPFYKIEEILNCLGHEVKIIKKFSGNECDYTLVEGKDENGFREMQSEYGFILNDPNKVMYNLIRGATGNY